MLEIEVLINSNKWKGLGINGDEKHKISNEYSDALLSKYKQALEFLKLSDENDAIFIAKFKRKVNYFKRKRFFGKYWFPILLFSLNVILFTLVSIFM
jgi:hypothetical protein